MTINRLGTDDDFGDETQRRVELRAFLIERRSGLTPADVGLPHTPHRRVTGLRREEVAELAGISTDWYRRFESGRPIRVSTVFLTRVAEALRLDGTERLNLFRLAIRELYEIDFARDDDAPLLQLATPVRHGTAIEAIARDVWSARTAFLTGNHHALTNVRPRIGRSWKRSVALGADPSRINIPPMVDSADALEKRRYARHMFLHAAQPVLTRLRSILERYALVLADEESCVLEVAGDAKTLRVMSQLNFQPGCDLRESAWGTNAIGTSIFDQRTLQVVGGEHFCAGGADFACTAAPIRDPIMHQIMGAIDVTCYFTMVRAEIVSIVNQAALEIEEQLYAYTGS